MKIKLGKPIKVTRGKNQASAEIHEIELREMEIGDLRVVPKAIRTGKEEDPDPVQLFPLLAKLAGLKLKEVEKISMSDFINLVQPELMKSMGELKS